MKTRKLVIALGLTALLLMTVGITSCGSAESEPPGNDQSANPLEDVTNPDESDDETQTTTEISISSEDLPEGPIVADGTIEKLTGSTFDLRQEKFEMVQEGGAWKRKEGSQPEIRMWQVVFSSSTEVLRIKMSGEGEMQTEKISVHDIEQGRHAFIWGEVDGSRIFADSILLY